MSSLVRNVGTIGGLTAVSRVFGFVRDMLTDKADWMTVEMIHQISHLAGRRTIAEFVENADILTALGAIGVDYAQGYFIGRPEPFLADAIVAPFRHADVA